MCVIVLLGMSLVYDVVLSDCYVVVHGVYEPVLCVNHATSQAVFHLENLTRGGGNTGLRKMWGRGRNMPLVPSIGGCGGMPPRNF